MNNTTESCTIIDEQYRTVHIYLKEIALIPLTTREEERELAPRIQADDRKALNRLVEGNLRFVVTIARNYYSRRMTLLDLINDGNLGLIEAAKRFKPETNCRFITYAAYWIRQYISRSLAENNYIVKLPQQMHIFRQRIKQVEMSLTRKLKRKPCLMELTITSDIEEEIIKQLIYVTNKSISLELHLHRDDENSEELKNYIPRIDGVEEKVTNAILVNELLQLLSLFSPRDMAIFLNRHGILDNGNCQTLDELGERFGLSKEGVRQIYKRVLRNLKKRL